MNARILLILQFVSLIVILGTAESLFTNRIATIAFATSFVTFARCSIYISKHNARNNLPNAIVCRVRNHYTKNLFRK